MSSPAVTNFDNVDGKMTFDMTNVDVSVANGLRRVLLSNIDTLAFQAFPHEECSIDITKNNTKFNNEYLKQRISCIPVHQGWKSLVVDQENKTSAMRNIMENYEIFVNVVNDTMNKIYITTENISIRSKNGDQKEVSKDIVQKFFPPDPITGDYIVICILYPNHNKIKPQDNECLTFNASFVMGNSDQNSCWNVVHHASYENMRDETKIQKVLQEKQLNKEDETDFLILDAQKIYIKNNFKFSLEGINVFSNGELMVESCNYILNKLGKIDSYVKEQNPVLHEKEVKFNEKNGMLSTGEIEVMKTAYCVIYHNEEFIILELKEDDYTMGKLIENHVYNFFPQKYSYIGFKKHHPTKKEAMIYFKYRDASIQSNPSNKHAEFYNDLNVTVSNLIQLFTSFRGSFQQS